MPSCWSRRRADPDLAVETGIRVDLPAELRQQLLRDATEAVRDAAVVARAAASVRGNPERDRGRVRRRQTAKCPRPAILPRPGATSPRCARRGKLNEPALLAFAKQRKYEETVAALAELSGSTIDVIRPVMQSLRDDGVLIPCRVAGLNWDTVSAVLDSRFASGAWAATNWRKPKSNTAN